MCSAVLQADNKKLQQSPLNIQYNCFINSYSVRLCIIIIHNINAEILGTVLLPAHCWQTFFSLRIWQNEYDRIWIYCVAIIFFVLIYFIFIYFIMNVFKYKMTNGSIHIVYRLHLLYIAMLFFFGVPARQYVVMLVWEFIYAYVLWHFRSDEEV